ncbi:MAG: hypothetical protein WC707_03925 [Candidatus Babeliaceae bacterium]
MNFIFVLLCAISSVYAMEEGMTKYQKDITQKFPDKIVKSSSAPGSAHVGKSMKKSPIKRALTIHEIQISTDRVKKDKAVEVDSYMDELRALSAPSRPTFRMENYVTPNDKLVLKSVFNLLLQREQKLINNLQNAALKIDQYKNQYSVEQLNNAELKIQELHDALSNITIQKSLINQLHHTIILKQGDMIIDDLGNYGEVQNLVKKCKQQMQEAKNLKNKQASQANNNDPKSEM